MDNGEVPEVIINNPVQLKYTFLNGDNTEIDTEYVEKWIGDVANALNLRSLQSKAKKYAQKFVEQECLETKHMMSTVTEQWMVDLDFPSGHAKAISGMIPQKEVCQVQQISDMAPGNTDLTSSSSGGSMKTFSEMVPALVKAANADRKLTRYTDMMDTPKHPTAPSGSST